MGNDVPRASRRRKEDVSFGKKGRNKENKNAASPYPDKTIPVVVALFIAIDKSMQRIKLTTQITYSSIGKTLCGGIDRTGYPSMATSSRHESTSHQEPEVDWRDEFRGRNAVIVDVAGTGISNKEKNECSNQKATRSS